MSVRRNSHIYQRNGISSSSSLLEIESSNTGRRRDDLQFVALSPFVHPALTTFSPQTLAEFIRDRTAPDDDQRADDASTSKAKGKAKENSSTSSDNTSSLAQAQPLIPDFRELHGEEHLDDIKERDDAAIQPVDMQGLLEMDRIARESFQPARLNFSSNAFEQLRGTNRSQDTPLDSQARSERQSPRKRRSARKSISRQVDTDTPSPYLATRPGPTMLPPRLSRRGEMRTRIHNHGSMDRNLAVTQTSYDRPPTAVGDNVDTNIIPDDVRVDTSSGNDEEDDNDLLCQSPSSRLPSVTSPVRSRRLPPTLQTAPARRNPPWMTAATTPGPRFNPRGMRRPRLIRHFDGARDDAFSEDSLDVGLPSTATPRAIVPYDYASVVPTQTPNIQVRDRLQPAAVIAGAKRARLRPRGFAPFGDPDDDGDDSDEDDDDDALGDPGLPYGFSSPNAKDLSIPDHNAERVWRSRGLPVQAGAPPHCPLPSNSSYQMPNLYDDIWIAIAEYLSIADIQALRLVSKAISAHMPEIQFRHLVTSFGPALEVMGAAPQTSVLAKYGPDIKKFGISFEFDAAKLAFASPKTCLKTEEAWYGSYKWPAQQYNRYESLKELEDLVDNNTPMLKNVFSHLRTTGELGLAVDSGHGWLEGPDISDMALLKIRQSKGSKIFDQAFGNEPAWEAYGRDEYFKWAQKNTINELLKHLAGRTGTADVLRMIEVVNSFEIRERDSFRDVQSQPDYNADSHTGGYVPRADNTTAAGNGGPPPAPPGGPPGPQYQPFQNPYPPMHPQPPPQGNGLNVGAQLQNQVPQPQHALALGQALHTATLGAHVQGTGPAQMPAPGHILHAHNLHQLQQMQMQMPLAGQNLNAQNIHQQLQIQMMHIQAQQHQYQQQQQQLQLLRAQQAYTSGIFAVPTLFGSPLQSADRSRGRTGSAKKSQAKQKSTFPLQWPLIFNGYNLAAETGGCLASVQARVAPPMKHAFHPGSLTEPQTLWLMETVWAQRTFLSAYTNAIISNSMNLTYVRTLTISKLSSGLLPSLSQPEFWTSLPSLRRVKLLVSPDWRKEHREQDVFIRSSSLISPLEAVGKFTQFLRRHICRLERLSHATIGWVGGGENAVGICARNQNLLPAPIISEPRNWISDHDKAFKGDPADILKFEHIRDLTFENCWFSPYMLEEFMKKTHDTSLHTVTFDSVSMLARHSSSLETTPLTTRGNNLACKHAENDWQHEELPASAAWTEVLDAITPGKTLLEHKYDAGMFDRDMEPMPKRSFRGNLKRIVLKSCGYAMIEGIKSEQFNQRNLVTQLEHTTDMGLRARASWLKTLITVSEPSTIEPGADVSRQLDAGSLMLSAPRAVTHTGWQGLGRLTQCVHPVEKRVLEQAWGMKFGWGNTLERWAAVEDAQLEGGTGRFSGEILIDHFDDEEDR